MSTQGKSNRLPVWPPDLGMWEAPTRLRGLRLEQKASKDRLASDVRGGWVFEDRQESEEHQAH